jgi:hypothetical protein
LLGLFLTIGFIGTFGLGIIFQSSRPQTQAEFPLTTPECFSLPDWVEVFEQVAASTGGGLLTPWKIIANERTKEVKPFIICRE